MTYDFPYPSQRMPVLARNVVATSQPLAAQAGLEALWRGGNAVDAALATAIALTVLEPTGNGIGSDAFALVWDGERLHGLNASGRAPARLAPERFAGRSEMPATGWESVTVPGAVSAWVALSERFGVLPFETLFGRAVRYAEEGFPISPLIARGWAGAPARFGAVDGFASAFLPSGRPPRAGETWRFPEQATTLRAIAESRGRAFYEGALADAMVADARAHGALLDHDDLARHRADWVEPIGVDYGGLCLHEIPPNGQGLAALVALGILQHLPLDAYEPDGVDALHLQIEAMKLALVDSARFVADIEHMDVAVADLLDREYLRERAALVDPTRAGDPRHGAPRGGGTVYLATGDASGMMVSFIQSNYGGFGSGVVVPGTGISLQNRGANFVLEPGHPNRVGGGKRPFTTIIPGFLTRGGAPLAAFGVMGGFMQAQGHVQMVVRLLHGEMNPQAASDAPRWRVDAGRRVALERGFRLEVVEGLRARGHEIAYADEVAATFGFGGAQLVVRGEDGYVAGSDHRKDGQAVGY
jgi:gamma-glutamyltranspeptidase / glutathione hydrolase